MTYEEQITREREAQALRSSCQDYVMAAISIETTLRDGERYLRDFSEASQEVVHPQRTGMYL